MRNFNQTVIDEFRANEGKVAALGDGAPVVLIHTTGAQSGRARVTPLVGLEDDGTIYIFGSAAGGPKNPDWYHNLVAHPEVEVEYGSERFPATATPITGAERDRLFARQKEVMPIFAEYETKTIRTIPVVALTRHIG
jgi:deazaflavin-dependent oxidoreductase (nitroreductase family)